MSDFAARIADEWEQAFQVKDERARKRAGSLISERFVDRSTYTHDISETRSDIRVLAEAMKLGFDQIDKRFEQVDKRFEQVDKRFEMLIGQIDRRFADVQRGVGRHTTTVLWAGAFLLTFLTALMSVYKFVR